MSVLNVDMKYGQGTILVQIVNSVWLIQRKVTTSATLANITQVENMTEVAVVIYAKNIQIGKVRNNYGSI